MPDGHGIQYSQRVHFTRAIVLKISALALRKISWSLFFQHADLGGGKHTPDCPPPCSSVLIPLKHQADFRTIPQEIKRPFHRLLLCREHFRQMRRRNSQLTSAQRFHNNHVQGLFCAAYSRGPQFPPGARYPTIVCTGSGRNPRDKSRQSP